MSDCLLNAYDRITGGGVFGQRIFERGGFKAPLLVRSGVNLILTGQPYGFRSNDDEFDIISDTELRVTMSIEGGTQPGGLHPDHFPRLSFTQYTIRIIGDSSGQNPTIVDAYQTDLDDPGLYPGYDKSRIVYQVMTTNTSNLYALNISQVGNSWRTVLGQQDGNLEILIDGNSTSPVDLDCSFLIPIGIKSIGIFALDFQTGAGGTIGDSLQVSNDAGQLSGTFDERSVLMPEVLLNTYTRIRRDINVNGISSMMYQVSDATNNLASIYCYGHEQTIGGYD